MIGARRNIGVRLGIAEIGETRPIRLQDLPARLAIGHRRQQLGGVCEFGDIDCGLLKMIDAAAVNKYAGHYRIGDDERGYDQKCDLARDASRHKIPAKPLHAATTSGEKTYPPERMV